MEMVNFGGGAVGDDLGEEFGESRREPNVIRKSSLIHEYVIMIAFRFTLSTENCQKMSNHYLGSSR